MLPLLSLLFLPLALTYGASIRGLNPDLAAQYSGHGGTFTCISGVAKTIPFSRVNDDYCDCSDGSDEPGTSACHNGRFYCRNLGHEPRLLASAFVDDGVCDCCDGTDEPKGKCQNTCLQASAVHREALKGKIAQYEQTLAKKAEYISNAKSFKDDLIGKSGTIDADIAAAQAEVDRLQEEVTRVEAEEAARRAEEERVRNEQREAEERAAQERAAEEQAAQEQAAAAAADFPETIVHGATTTTTSDDEGRELQEEAQQAQPEEREETPEERGRRIASQWTNDPESAAVHEDVRGEEEQHEEPQEEEPPYEAEPYDPNMDMGEGEYQTESEPVPPPRPAATTPLGEVRARLYDAQRTLERLKKDKSDIQTYLAPGTDHGPNDIFLALNKCFTSYQTRWTYEMCPFKEATQREGYGSNRVVVGRWFGFSRDYKTMIFNGGDQCANVGRRSFTVDMQCGHENKLSDGEEPATCEYTAKFTTPALCNEDELEELRQQLRNLEAFEKEVQAIIAKDEL